MKYVDTKEVFAEIPDEITLAISISGCPIRCKGCHSQYLWEDIGSPLDTDAVEGLLAKNDNISCIAFMGGDASPAEVNQLATYVHAHHPSLKVAWYSGRIRIPAIINKKDFDYIKIGPFIRHLGPLNKETTNQRLYRQTADGQFEDITNRFWKTKN